MKENNFFLILVILIISAVLFSRCGVQQNKDESLPVWETMSFPIAGWISFGEEDLDLSHFQELADAGFTITSAHYEDAALNLKAMDLAQQVGVKVAVVDMRIQPDEPVDDEARRKIEMVAADYKDHPAYFGFLVRDEPNAGVFKFMADIKKHYLSHDPVHLAFANLLPDYASSEQLGTPTYQEHVDTFMRIYQPRILSYDYYPFTNQGFRETYYQNLGVIRDAAKKAGVPFWAFTMTCEIDPAYPTPKEPWVRLQAFTDLAYGARGIQYFTYGLPSSETENFITAILDKDGNKTYLYDIARRLNAEIHALAPTIKQLRSIGVFHAEPLPKGTQGIPPDFMIKSIDGLPIFTGHFLDSEDIEYVMLVNREYEFGGKIQITVSEDVAGFVEISKVNGKDKDMLVPEDNIITVQFYPGDGRLFRVE